MTDAFPPVSIEELLVHRTWVEALARRLVRDASVADDVVQKTWAAALQSPPRDRGRLRGWLRTVVRNFARESYRAEKRREVWERCAARLEETASTEEICARVDAERAVSDAVMGLPPLLRDVVLLRYYENLPPRLIGKRLGVPTETVRSRLKKAMQVLRERLDARAGGDGRTWVALVVPLVRSPSPWPTPARVAKGLTRRRVGVAAAAAAVLAVAWVATGRLRGLDSARETGLAPRGPSPPASARVPRQAVADRAGRAELQVEDNQKAVVGASRPSDDWSVRGHLISRSPLSSDARTHIVIRTISPDAKPELSQQFTVDARGDQFAVPLPGLADVEVAELDVSVDDPAYLPARTRFMTSDALGRRASVLDVGDLELVPASVVAGTVLDAGGVAVGGCDVGVFADGSGSTVPIDAVTTVSDGTYRLRVRTGTLCRVVAAAFGARPAVSGVVSAAEGHPVRVDFALQRGHVLRGRLDDDTDRAVLDSATVVLTLPGSGPLRYSLPHHALTGGDDGLDEQMLTVPVAADGTFVVEGLSSHKRRVAVSYAGETGDLRDQHARDVEPPRDDVVVTTGGAALGIAVTAGGVPVPDAQITVVGLGRINRVTTDSGGQATLVGIAGHSYELKVSVEDHEPGAATVVLPAQGGRVAIALAPVPEAATWRLVLRGPDAHVISKAAVLLTRETADHRQQTVYQETAAPSDGDLVLRKIPPGAFHATIRPGGSWYSTEGLYEQIETDVVFAPGQTVDAAFDARPAGRLRLSVRDAAGGLLGATCVLRDAERRICKLEFLERTAGGLAKRSVQLGTTGVTDVEPPLTPGRYSMDVSCKGYESSTVEFNVDPLRMTEMTISLRPQ